MKWRNLLSPAKIAQAARIESCAAWMLRHGWPDVILEFLGGLGDELLLTCVAHEIRARNPAAAVWQISPAAELLYGNPDYSLILDQRYWDLRHSNLLRLWRKRLHYSKMQIAGAYEIPPREHILAVLCRAAGLQGLIQLRPWCFLECNDVPTSNHFTPQICVQSMGEVTHASWMKNKVWFHDRMQCVIDEFIARHPELRVLQIGVEKDPLLNGTVDLRGITTLRQTASKLKQSYCFLGTSGFLAHLARAVDCRSVVIYGGREHAWQSGYSCNENLETRMACAPCWLWHDCDFDRQCMRDVTVEDVLNALDRAIARHGWPLEVDEIVLEQTGPQDPKSYPTVPGSQEISGLPPFIPK